MINGPYKTLGLAKILSNFMGLSLSFLVVMCVWQSRFFNNAAVSGSFFFFTLSLDRDFRKAKEVAKSLGILNFNNATFKFLRKG